MTLWRRHIQGLISDPARPILPWLAPRAFRPWPEYAGQREVSTVGRNDGAGQSVPGRGQSSEREPTRPHRRSSVLRSSGQRASATVKSRTDFCSAKRSAVRTSRSQNTSGRLPRIFKVYGDYDEAGKGKPAGLASDTQHPKNAGHARADDWYEAILGLNKSPGDTRHETRQHKPSSREKEGRCGKGPEGRKFVQMNHQRKDALKFLNHVGNRNSEIGRAYIEAWRQKEELAAKLPTRRQRKQRGTLTMVSLGRLVLTYGKRHSRQGGDFLYLEGDFSREWFQWMAHLRRPYSSKPGSRTIIPPSLDPSASKWARSVLEGGKLPRDTDERLGGFDGCRYRIWMEAMLWILKNEPDNALKFLLDTHLKPLPPVYMHGQVMEFLILRATARPASIDQETLVKLAQTIAHISRRAKLDPFDMDGYYMTLLVKACEQPTIQRVIDYLGANSRVPLQTRLLAIRQLGKGPDTLESAIAQVGKLGSVPPYFHDWIRRICFSILRKTAGRKNGPDLCIQAVSNLIKCGIDLNVPLCTAIMLNAVAAHDSTAAFTVYDMVRDNKLKPDRYLFVALIRACKLLPDDSERLAAVIETALQQGQLLENPYIATEVLSALYKHHTKANRADTYKVMVDAYNQLFNAEPLHFLAMSPMVSQRQGTMAAIGPPLSIVIQAYLSHGKPTVREALQRYRVLRRLAKAGREPYAELFRTSHTCNAFIAWFAAQDSGLAWVVEVVRNMENDARESSGSAASISEQPASNLQNPNSPAYILQADSTSYLTPPITSVAEDVTTPEMATSVSDSVEDSEPEFGGPTINATHRAPEAVSSRYPMSSPHIQHGNVVKSDTEVPSLEELVGALEDKSTETDTYSKSLDTSTEHGNKTSSESQPPGFAPPERITFSILHYVLCKHADHSNSRIKHAGRVLAQMLRQGYEVDYRTWLSMLNAYKRLHHFDKAFWCIDKMVESKCWDEAKGKNVRLQLELEQHRLNKGRKQQQTGDSGEAVEDLDIIEAGQATASG